MCIFSDRFFSIDYVYCSTCTDKQKCTCTLILRVTQFSLCVFFLIQVGSFFMGCSTTYNSYNWFFLFFLQSNVCLPMSVYIGLLHYFISSIIFHCVDVASLNQIPLMDIYIFPIFFIITKNVAMDPLSCTS